MKIQIDPSVLKETKWHQYAVRFVFGGLITAMAGVISKEFGPVIGGLFLAFPAIFPASATLIEKHEEEKERAQRLKRHSACGRCGQRGRCWGRDRQHWPRSLWADSVADNSDLFRLAGSERCHGYVVGSLRAALGRPETIVM